MIILVIICKFGKGLRDPFASTHSWVHVGYILLTQLSVDMLGEEDVCTFYN